MYGILVEAIKYMILEKWGEDVLHDIFTRAKVTATSFSSHERYSEKLLPGIMSATAETTNMSVEDVGLEAGRFFVRFMCSYGYSDLMKASGRRFGDFLKGLDNMHEYFRFSYPKIRPPSFYCTKENASGVTIHYRSRRQGFVSYVMGQLVEIGRILFDMEITVKLIKKEQKGSFLFATLSIKFDNAGFEADQALREKSLTLNEFLPIDSVEFLNMFPYYIGFNKRLEIIAIGKALLKVMPDLLGHKIDEEFDLQRPCIKFTWDGCLHHLNNVFQLESTYPIQKKANQEAITFQVNDLIEDKVEVPEGLEHHYEDGVTATHQIIHNVDEEDDDVIEKPYLFLKGPMIYLKSQELLVVLPTVTVENVDQLFEMGLYIDDYGKADCNRELILASTQKSDDLKTMLDAEKQKAKDLSVMVKEIDSQKKRARNLLATMMPKAVAKELTSTGTIKKISYSYEEASIAFVKVNDFNTLVEPLSPLDVVSLLNMIYSTFDAVIDRHGVYKVETIGESYMISCGVPKPSDYHAEYLADTALELLVQVKDIKMNGLAGRRVMLKIGMHSGPVVGGVVGQVAPRFCLFGDTVNCASRMESHNKKPMSIQISVKTFECLRKQAPKMFKFEDRGEINLKGKGNMKCYSLFEKVGPARCDVAPIETELEDLSSDDEFGSTTPLDEVMEDEGGSSMSRMSMGHFDSRAGSSRQSAASRASSVASHKSGGSNSSRRSSRISQADSDLISSNAKSHKIIGNRTATTPPPTTGEGDKMARNGKGQKKEREEPVETINSKAEDKRKLKDTAVTDDYGRAEHDSRASDAESRISYASIIEQKLTVSGSGSSAKHLLSADPADISATFEKPLKTKDSQKKSPIKKDKANEAIVQNGIIDKREKEALHKEVREIINDQIEDAVEMEKKRNHIPKKLQKKAAIPPITSKIIEYDDTVVSDETDPDNEEDKHDIESTLDGELDNRITGEDIYMEAERRKHSSHSSSSTEGRDSFASERISLPGSEIEMTPRSKVGTPLPLPSPEHCICEKVKEDKKMRTKICTVM